MPDDRHADRTMWTTCERCGEHVKTRDRLGAPLVHMCKKRAGEGD